MKTRYLFCIGIILLLFSGCVDPQNFAALENRVAAIEMEERRLLKENEKSDESAVQKGQNQSMLKKDLEGEKFNENSMSQEEYADLKYNVQTVREDIQRLDGLIETINHNFENFTQKDREGLEKKLERLDNAISKNYEKIIKLEKYMGFEPSAAIESEKATTLPEAATPPEAKVSPEITVSPETKAAPEAIKIKNPELELYNFAKKLFDDGDKENARIQFENFINKYPESENADNARFWIADSYYAEKWFEKAILEYQKVLEEYPNSNKLAAARLKQGYAFAELGEKANARLILKELIKKHPATNEAKYAQEKLKTLN